MSDKIKILEFNSRISIMIPLEFTPFAVRSDFVTRHSIVALVLWLHCPIVTVMLPRREDPVT